MACFLFATGCTEKTLSSRGDLTLEDFSEWRDNSYSIDSQIVAKCLEQYVSAKHDSIYFDFYVLKHYKEAKSPLWITGNGLNASADTLLSTLQREVPQMGFSPKAFFIDNIEDAIEQFHSMQFDETHPASQVAAELDYLLTKAYMRYALGQRYGFARPYQVYNYLDAKSVDTLGRVKSYNHLYDIKVEEPDYSVPLRKLMADSVCEYLREVLPQDPVYLKLQKRMADAQGDERQKLALNMERRRWRTDRADVKPRYILVNVAAQHLWAVCPDSVLPMRICCGAVKTKSPLLQSAISHMEVNPAWGIPMSIIRNEVARHGGDSGYFARRRYTIYGPNGPVNPRNVSAAMLNSGRYSVSQKGGAGNSLGRIVFRFPNRFSVYLHDTSNRGAFQYENRALSHGCIRVQKPFELAQFLLPGVDDWTLDKIRLSMDLPPATQQGRNYLSEHASAPRPLRLINRHDVSPQVPLVIDYYTAYPNPKTGEIETWPDGYGYDKALLRVIKPFLP